MKICWFDLRRTYHLAGWEKLLFFVICVLIFIHCTYEFQVVSWLILFFLKQLFLGIILKLVFIEKSFRKSSSFRLSEAGMSLLKNSKGIWPECNGFDFVLIVKKMLLIMHEKSISDAFPLICEYFNADCPLQVHQSLAFSEEWFLLFFSSKTNIMFCNNFVVVQ